MTVNMSLPNRTIGAMLGALVLSACATTPRSMPGKEIGASVAMRDSACVTNNLASRIPQAGPQCSTAGRSYSSDDIARTGATTAGQALQLLDPSITVTR